MAVQVTTPAPSTDRPRSSGTSRPPASINRTRTSPARSVRVTMRRVLSPAGTTMVYQSTSAPRATRPSMPIAGESDSASSGLSPASSASAAGDGMGRGSSSSKIPRWLACPHSPRIERYEASAGDSMTRTTPGSSRYAPVPSAPGSVNRTKRAQVGAASRYGGTVPSAARASSQVPRLSQGPSGDTVLTATSSCVIRSVATDPVASSHSSRSIRAARSSRKPTTQLAATSGSSHIGRSGSSASSSVSGRYCVAMTQSVHTRWPPRTGSATLIPSLDGAQPGSAMTFHSPRSMESWAPVHDVWMRSCACRAGTGSGRTNDWATVCGPSSPERTDSNVEPSSERRSSNALGRASSIPSRASGSRTMPTTGAGASPARSTWKVSGPPWIDPLAPSPAMVSPSCRSASWKWVSSGTAPSAAEATSSPPSSRSGTFHAWWGSRGTAACVGTISVKMLACAPPASRARRLP